MPSWRRRWQAPGSNTPLDVLPNHISFPHDPHYQTHPTRAKPRTRFEGPLVREDIRRHVFGGCSRICEHRVSLNPDTDERVRGHQPGEMASCRGARDWGPRDGMRWGPPMPTVCRAGNPSFDAGARWPLRVLIEFYASTNLAIPPCLKEKQASQSRTPTMPFLLARVVWNGDQTLDNAGFARRLPCRMPRGSERPRQHIGLRIAR